MCRDASRREFDIVMAWSVDRLGRSLQDLVNFLSELHALRVDLFLKTQGIDTTTPSGKAMFGIYRCLPTSSVRSSRNESAPGLCGLVEKENALAGRPYLPTSNSESWPP